MKRLAACFGWGILVSFTVPLVRWARQTHYEP